MANKSWNEMTDAEKEALGYGAGIEAKLKRERKTWDKPKKERSDEYVSHVDYAGERSAYWDWVERKAPINSDGEPEELAMANPDCVNDEECLPSDYITESVALDEMVFEANRLARIYLTKSELRLWNYTREHPLESWATIAKDLKISVKYVERVLKNIRKKLSVHFLQSE